MKKPGNSPDSGKKIMRYAVIQVRLRPAPEQAVLMEKTFGSCRWLWNRMLADAQEFYAAADAHYVPAPARYKKDAPFLKEVDSQALCAVHQNLRKAFLDFFRNPAAFQYPKFKTKKSKKDSFTVYCRPYRTGPSIRLVQNGIQMPKLGLVPANIYRNPPENYSLRYITVTKSKSGKYYGSLVFGGETPEIEPIAPTPERTLGLNYSLTRFYVDSGGNSPELPALDKSKAKLARLQQKLSKMEHGSKNYEKQSQKIRLLHEHMANQRKDFAHQESRRIANAWDAVCVRETDLRELSKKLRQGGVTDFGFGGFREYLKYKLEQQGKCYIVLDRLAPAARTCHECGSVNEHLKNRDRNWICPHCGASVSREINAAKNIRDMGLAQFKNIQNAR